MFLELFLFAKKMKFLTKGRDSLYFQVFPWHFNFMRGHSLVELTEHEDSAAADIILHALLTGRPGSSEVTMYVVVVVFFTLTDRASTIPSNIRGCQSGTWSQRGNKVNGSHHGDNPLLRPTGIQIATKGYATLQAMAPTNNKTVHQTSFTPYREQPRSTWIDVAYPRPAFSATNRTSTFQPVLINTSKFLKATHRTKIREIEIYRGPWWWRP